MKSFSCFLLSAALFVTSVSAQLTVNTPANVVQCAPLTITWSAGTAPYFVSIHSGNDVNGAPLISFPSTTTTSLTWQAVNFTAGTSLDVSLRDSAGASSQSAIFTVQPGGDSSCLNGGSPTSGAATGAGSSAPGASSTGATPATTAAGPTATTPAGSGSTTTPAKASGSAASASSARPSSTNAAMATGITYGAAGVLGAVVAAVFV